MDGSSEQILDIRDSVVPPEVDREVPRMVGYGVLGLVFLVVVLLVWRWWRGRVGGSVPEMPAGVRAEACRDLKRLRGRMGVESGRVLAGEAGEVMRRFVGRAYGESVDVVGGVQGGASDVPPAVPGVRGFLDWFEECEVVRFSEGGDGSEAFAGLLERGLKLVSREG